MSFLCVCCEILLGWWYYVIGVVIEGSRNDPDKMFSTTD